MLVFNAATNKYVDNNSIHEAVERHHERENLLARIEMIKFENDLSVSALRTLSEITPPACDHELHIHDEVGEVCFICPKRFIS